MGLVPARSTVLLALVPFGLAVGAVFDHALVRFTLAGDAVLAVALLVDALLAVRPMVRAEREVPPVLSIGRSNPIRLHLRSTSARRLDVRVTDDRPAGVETAELPARVSLAPRGQASVVYHLRPTRRGLLELGDHHLRYASPLGLWWRQLRLPARDPLRVYPDVTAVREYELLARKSREGLLTRPIRLRGGENEFERLREYGRDDDFRNIDWKATARRSRLIVREYQQERNQTVVCLLDCGRLMTAETGGLTQLDHALNAVIMLAHVASRAGDQFGLLAFDAGIRTYLGPRGGRQVARQVARATYDLHPSLADSDFERAFAHLGAHLRKRALVVLFTQVIDDVSARAVLRQVRGLPAQHLALCVIFRDPDLDRLAEPPGGVVDGGPGDLYAGAAAAETILWREKLTRDLKANGAMVLHIPPAQTTPAVINRYLRIKARHLL